MSALTSIPVMGFFLVVANVCGAGMIVPQVLRLHRTGDASGVSAGWTGVGIGLNAWWAVYAVAQQLWGLLPVSVVALLLYGAMAAQLVVIDRPRSVTGVNAAVVGLGLGLAATAVPPALALLAGGWSSLGLALGLAYAVQFLPALAAVLSASSRSGVSIQTWRMALVEASVWLVYGLQLDDVALIIGGTGGALAASAIVVLLSSDGRPRFTLLGPSMRTAR